MTKRMPPGQIDNKVSHKMKNEMNLTDAEMQTLVRWVNAGAPVDGDGIHWLDFNGLKLSGLLPKNSESQT